MRSYRRMGPKRRVDGDIETKRNECRPLPVCMATGQADGQMVAEARASCRAVVHQKNEYMAIF